MGGDILCSATNFDSSLWRMAIICACGSKQEMTNTTNAVERHSGVTPGIMAWGTVGNDFRSPLTVIAKTLMKKYYFSDIQSLFSPDTTLVRSFTKISVHMQHWGLWTAWDMLWPFSGQLGPLIFTQSNICGINLEVKSDLSPIWQISTACSKSWGPTCCKNRYNSCTPVPHWITAEAGATLLRWNNQCVVHLIWYFNHCYVFTWPLTLGTLDVFRTFSVHEDIRGSVELDNSF